MVFSTLLFLFRFLPITLALYYLAPAKWKNTVLFVCSLVFYSWGEVRLFPIMALAILINYTAGLGMEKFAHSKRARLFFLIYSIVGSIGMLMFFKYTNFFITNINALLGTSIATLSLTLPLGISFFTVQSVGYAVDVYRKKYAAEPSACNFALFVSFFPLISSGPIMRGDKLLPQLRAPRALRTDRAAHALVTFALGLFSKVAVADLLAVFANAVYGDVTAYTGLTLTFGALCYGLQLYFDFSGYSLMALGAAELLGLQLTTNFDTPYFSRSIREFWGRWHISFSSWLKDYVYIPLGGNRKGKARKYLNLLLTFLVSGVWHGVGLTYLIWGALHGVYQIAGDATDRLRGRVYAALHVSRTGRLACAWQCLCTFALVNAAWVFFRAASVHDALYVLTAQFRNVSLTGLLADIRAIAASFNAKSLLSAAFLAFVLLALAGGVLLDCARRFKAPGGDLSARMLSLPLIFRWLLYYALAAFIFAGFLMNNGYFATAANFLYNNF